MVTTESKAASVEATRAWLAQEYPLTLKAYPWLPEHGPRERLEDSLNLRLDELERAQKVCPACAGFQDCPFQFGGLAPVLRIIELAYDGGKVLRQEEEPCRYARAAMLTREQDALERDLDLPARVKRLLASGLKDTAPVRAAKEWAQSLPEGKLTRNGLTDPANLSDAPNLIIAGPTGTGKTVAAAVALIEATRRTLRPARFWSVSALLNSLRPTSDGEPRRRVEDFAAIPLLGLDDLGTERVTDWAAEQLDALFNLRYEALRPVVVTTNLTRQKLEQQLGPRIVSRLLHGAKLVAAKGTDMRRGGAKL